MAKMPVFEDTDDIEETPVVIHVPKGWAVETDDEDEDDLTGDEIHAEEDEPLEDMEARLYDEPVAPAPKRKSWVEDEDTDEVVPIQRNLPKRNRGWIEDDYDDDQSAPAGSDDDAEPVVTKRMPVLDDDTPENAVPVAVQPAKPKPVPQPRLSVTRLSERAMLVSLNISQWSGRRFDRKVSEEVNSRKAASANAGRYNKVLLPDCAELAEVHRLTSSMRNWFVEQTMPWMNDGARIMPSKRYLGFNAEFRKRKGEWDAAFANLETAYPSLLARAPHQLKDMFEADDYPHQSELRAKFSMGVRIFPLPDRGDFRVDLDDKIMKEIADSMVNQEAELAGIVVADCAARLSKVVGAMAERLSDVDAIFRDSLVDNLCETVEVLKDLNITDDPEIEALRQEAEAKLTGYSATELRTNVRIRAEAAKAASDIARKMDALMGV